MQGWTRAVLAAVAVVLAAGLAGCASGSPTTAPRDVSGPHARALSNTVHYATPPAGIAAVQLFHPMGEYTVYVEELLAVVRSQLRALRAQIAAGDLAGARGAWQTAHISWLELGQDDGAYGAFGNLGAEIDGTADGDVGGVKSRAFSGFHRVEFDLFRERNLRAAARDSATLSKLVGSITAQVVAHDLALSTVSLDTWVLRAHEILEDALRDSLSQEDDYGSNSDLADVLADVTATREMLYVLAPLIEPRAPGLVPRAERELTALDRAVAVTRRRGSWPAVRALAPRERQLIDADAGAALETLAPVSELMQITGANS